MFELIPFERRANRVATYDPFRDLEEFERSVFGGSSVMGSFRNDVLTISAEHSYDSKDDEKAEEKAEKGKKNYVKRERYYGSYTRSFDVSAVEVDKIDAEYSDGVLKLTMPKKAALIPASRRLEIK